MGEDDCALVDLICLDNRLDNRDVAVGQRGFGAKGDNLDGGG